MKRKTRLLFLAAVSLLVLAGFGKKRVELLSDKKLIDLNAAIAVCLPGADSAQQEDKQNREEIQDTAEPTVTPKPALSPTAKPELPKITELKERIIVISVRGKSITYDSKEQMSADKLKDRIKKDYREKFSVQLVDDYAEAHVYREVMAVLEELEEELGLAYTRD